MSTPEAPDQKPSTKRRIPRWTAPIMWGVGLILVHVLLPWGISLLTPRYGWVDGRPGVWNYPALILVAAGIGMIIWGASLHFRAAPGGWEWERTPGYMLVKGPYKYSRNPMYLLEIVMWLGWAIFYGSVAVGVTFVLWWVMFAFVMIPSEERVLEARFGQTYLDYKNSVPRWFGLPRR